MALVRGSSLKEEAPLHDWALAESSATAPDEVTDWLPLEGPSTIASALRRLGRWEFGIARAFDDETFWLRFRTPARETGGPVRSVLALLGLATFAEAFVDGRSVLASDNMFHRHRLELSPGEHVVAIRFASLSEALAKTRPRPRWKTRLVSHQSLRWVRTSLVGRMPGWSPPVPPIGAWRPIVLERWTTLEVASIDLRVDTVLAEPACGVVTVDARLDRIDRSVPLSEASLVVGDVRTRLEVTTAADAFSLRGTLAVPSVALWWPHTHGAQPRYPARLELVVGDRVESVDLGAIAFRTLHLDTDDGAFSLSVNGAPIFCRGAAWTTTDVTTLTGTDEAYARVLDRVTAAGMNMLRLSGTMFYESDAFYEACDARGILVWQDFAFANMDYPLDDEAFRTSVVREASELAARLQARPSIAIVCGGSEVEQQAAMFGAAREIWRSPLAAEVLPDALRAWMPTVPYVPSTPSGGALPFHVDEGCAHYYGVGAYLRPFEDVRRAHVRFASECLALANVPEDDLFPSFLADGQVPFVHARWKERTSKDHGSAWDFEDVRDHYLALLFRVDPMRLRYEDVDRYLRLSRITSGEVMARVFAELRRHGSPSRGGLVWFLQDLWPGAGWGVLDARGEPKAPYWFLARVLAPVALFVTDEGVNGLHLHLVNDTAETVTGVVRLALYQGGEVATIEGSREVVLAPRSSARIVGDAVLPTFADSARAYRFGPPGHDVAVASFERASAEPIEVCHLLDFAAPPACHGLEARLEAGDTGELVAVVSAKSFAHAITIDVPHHRPSDAYFDLAPGRTRRIRLVPTSPSPRPPRGSVSAANLRTTIPLSPPTKEATP